MYVEDECTLAHVCKVHDLDPFLFVRVSQLKQLRDDTENELGIILMDKVKPYIQVIVIVCGKVIVHNL